AWLYSDAGPAASVPATIGRFAAGRPSSARTGRGESKRSPESHRRRRREDEGRREILGNVTVSSTPVGPRFRGASLQDRANPPQTFASSGGHPKAVRLSVCRDGLVRGVVTYKEQG